MNLDDELKNKLENLLTHEERNRPTCLIFECVLVYMEPDKSDSILKYLTSSFGRLFCISYEQVNLSSRFGEVMLNNLISRGCGLNGYESCKSVESQKERFHRAGFSQVNCRQMDEIYSNLSGRLDIEKLEFLDDVEIFKQLLQHYSITTATNNHSFEDITHL
jgi:[phosphatase 2A protein]-leucine-carboxy methyltransferase